MKAKYYCFECEYCTGGKIMILGQAMCGFFKWCICDNDDFTVFISILYCNGQMCSSLKICY